MVHDSKPPSDISRRFEVWERHGQTIMLGVTLAALTFTGKFMWDVNTRLSELATENKHLTNQVAEMKGTLNAMQLNYVTRNEFNDTLNRVRDLEKLGRAK